jgi:hypothetical protein
VAAFVLGFCAIQIAIPAVMLVQRGGLVFAPEDPQTGELPFSWQMYTVVLAPPTATITWPDEREEVVLLEPLLGQVRARLAYDDAALRTICRAYPGARTVTYASAGARKARAC